MCSVSAVISDFQKHDFNWPIQPVTQWPDVLPETKPSLPDQTMPIDLGKELAKIKKFQENLEKAKQYDKETNQPDCESPEKVQFVSELLERLDNLAIELVQEGDNDRGLEIIQIVERIRTTLEI